MHRICNDDTATLDNRDFNWTIAVTCYFSPRKAVGRHHNQRAPEFITNYNNNLLPLFSRSWHGSQVWFKLSHSLCFQRNILSFISFNLKTAIYSDNNKYNNNKDNNDESPMIRSDPASFRTSSTRYGILNRVSRGARPQSSNLIFSTTRLSIIDPHC